jgi:hypothetical protein
LDFGVQNRNMLRLWTPKSSEVTPAGNLDDFGVESGWTSLDAL